MTSATECRLTTTHRRIGVVFDDVDAFNAEKHEGEEQYIDELYTEKEHTERGAGFEFLQGQTGCIVSYKHTIFPRLDTSTSTEIRYGTKIRKRWSNRAVYIQ
jgi:hypothetical protein